MTGKTSKSGRGRKKSEDVGSTGSGRQRPTMAGWQAARLTPRPRAILDWMTKYIVVDDLGGRFYPSPWQTNLVRDVYRGEVNGPMPIDRVIITVGRKNGKTTFVVGLNIFGMSGPQASRGRWWLAAAAGSVKQANIFFTMFDRIIGRSPALARRFHIAPSAMTITHRSNRNTLVTVSTNARAAQGYEIEGGGYLMDEFAQARTGDLLNAFDYSTRTTDRGLGFTMSSMAVKQGNPLAAKIADVRASHKRGAMTNWHLCIHSADLDKYSEWSDKALKAANPGLVAYPGHPPVVDWELLKADREAAKASPREKTYFLAFRLNSGKSDGAHLCDAITWKRLQAKTRPTPDELAGARCIVGIDLSLKGDFTSMAAFHPDIGAGGPEGCGYLEMDNFYPKSRIEDVEETHKIPAGQWAAAGWITVTDGRVVDYSVVVDRLVELIRDRDVVSIRYDDWNKTSFAAALALQDIDLETDPRFQNVGQGFKSMTPIVGEAERRIENGLLRHSGCPVLSFCLDGMLIHQAARTTSDSRKPIKADSSAKIDAAVAALMAMAPIEEPDAPKEVQAPTIFYDALGSGAFD